MPLTTNAINFITQATMSKPTKPFDNTNAKIGVGNGNTAFAVGQTDLSGTTKTYLTMDSTYPKVTATSLNFRSTADFNTANHPWLEWGVFNGPSSATDKIMLNRVVKNLGTKIQGQKWILNVTINFTI